MREILTRVLLVIGALFVSVLVCEFGLRAYYSFSGKSDKYYVYPPNLQHIMNIKPGIMQGVAEKARFYTTSDGLRGDEISKDDAYRILAIGGSTTACLYLDQDKAWPYALQKKLSEFTCKKVWVGNAGKAGLSTREHLMHVKYLLPQFSRIDAIIILVGCNDLFRRLIEDDNYDPRFLENYASRQRKLMNGAFSRTPYYSGKYRFKTGYYDQTAIGSLYIQLKTAYTRKTLIQDVEGEYVSRLQNLRKDAHTLVDRLPDLDSGLAEYRNNLNAIIDMVQSKSIRLIFITQPSLLRPNMPQHEKDLITSGWIENEKSGRYYTAEALSEGLERYNEELKRVCRNRGIELIDLAAILPRSTDVFYDEVHLNDHGSLLTADIIFNFLKAKAFGKKGNDAAKIF